MVFSGAGYPGSWEFAFTNERALAFLKGTKAMSGLLATPLSATYLRNTYITIQQPLHAITEIGQVSLKKGLRTKVFRPHEIYLKFNTVIGKFAMGIADAGSHPFGDLQWSLNTLSIMRDDIVKNKKYIAEYLLRKSILTEPEAKQLIIDFDKQRSQKVIIEEAKKGKELVHKYRFSSIDSDILMYANDLRQGIQSVDLKKEK
ncbi:MAG: hypothetical protein JSV56_09710 [Methanomassiliicoccales archaeon]|nr:MAG: hypothetical protein JSV56_09710 [Methanomassiliicoccales archaeon]